MAPPLTYETFAARVVAEVPDLAERYAINQTRFGGQQYTFGALVKGWMADLCAEAIAHPETRSRADGLLSKLFAILEEGLASPNRQVQDLVVAGYLEALNPTAPYFPLLVAHFGPETRKLGLDQAGGR